MENGEKVQISLESGLDIRSGDMLVPIGDPKFTHNRQCFQGRVLPTSLRFEHDGWACGRQVWQFPFEDGKMKYVCTDVDEPELEGHEVAVCDTASQYQFLKQQWDTTDAVENFWWIDSERVLVLMKDWFVLRRKDGGLDDWDGDTFTEEARWPRSGILHEGIDAYLCSSVYGNERARFVTISVAGNGFRITVYDPLTMAPFQWIVPIGKSSIGSPLVQGGAQLWTYSNLVSENVASHGKWTATCRNGVLVLGLHFDNNFNQWAMVFDIAAGSLLRVIQGYGFVGVDGSLTGGEIPSYCFSAASGFTGTVLPMATLSGTERDVTDRNGMIECAARIVGTEEQQWYIRGVVPSIVSHLVMNGTSHVAVELPLNNNYAADYRSGSFKSMVFGDFKLEASSLIDVFAPGSMEGGDLFSVLFTVLKAVFTPLNPIFMFHPSISSANYLQQSAGQAAYVHYNSTSLYQPKDLKSESLLRNYAEEEWTHESENRPMALAVTEDEISFDRRSLRQKQSIEQGALKDSLVILMAMTLVSALDYAEDRLRVNATQNQTAGGDTGRKYSQFFLQNMASLAVSDMKARSVIPSNNSEVSVVKTLDMFYSTSDLQKICAGRGYVNHNFVAQCVAQSVTSVQAEFTQQRLMWIIKALTMVLIDAELKAAELALDMLDKQIQSQSGPNITGVGAVEITTPSSMIVEALVLAREITYTAYQIIKYAREYMDSLLDATGMTKLSSSVAGYLTRHAYDVEGKHRYGSRSECFMWPCFGVPGRQEITEETVSVTYQMKNWLLDMEAKMPRVQVDAGQPAGTTTGVPADVYGGFKGDVPYFITMTKGGLQNVMLPERMAYVIGAESFLPTDAFKNENIGESEPVFPTPPFQDYMIDGRWELSQTASVGMTTWVSCGDTKILDGEFSNIIVSDDFCGVAAPYTAIEVKRGITRKYLRPWAVTPNALSLNITGLNCCYEKKAYHAFDGQGYRVVSWMGSPGMNKEKQTWLYSFLLNDRFKRGNKLPQNEYLGNYKSDPVVALSGNADDKVFTLVTRPGENEGLIAGAVGEDKDVRRYSAPVFTEFVSTLPAAVKTITAYPFSIIDGVTSLTSGNRDLQTAYKSPLSVDFTIGKMTYRYTHDFICSVRMERGVTVTEDIVPCLGLTYIGATPYEAYLYSPDTKMYYRFRGSGNLEKVDMIERFRNVKNGRYDFVRQEVLMPCLATFERVDSNVHDDEDETDNVMIPRLIEGEFKGEVWPPLETIFNTRSWFRTLSLPCGVTYQGPNRCIINRFTYQSYMRGQIISNYGKWRKVPREEYHPFRGYAAKYERVDEDIGELVGVKGWTHNPFLLVTAPIGVNDDTDCVFEWEITFAWPVEMDELYGKNDYAVVNVQGQCMTPGGKVISARPVHVFLTKELFTRTGNYGFYSFRYQSKCGAGNRERLHIWSDQYIAVSALQCEYKTMTQKRTEILTQQVDTERLHEI